MPARLKKIVKWSLIVVIVLLAPIVLFIGYALVVRKTTPIVPKLETVGTKERFQIVKKPKLIASIDVFVTKPEHQKKLRVQANQLLLAARTDPDFVAGAVHNGLPASDQPLHELGWVPNKEAWVAIYAQWKDSGRRKGLTGTNQGVAILKKMAKLSPWAKSMIDNPLASLYQPTLLDATGEHCNRKVCKAGLGVGPIVDENNPKAGFINIFVTTPDRQEKLLQTTNAILPVVRHHAGYLTTALHRSLDGKRVANYGQYQKFRQVSDMYFHFRTFLAFGAVLVKDVTSPLFCFGICIGDHPILRTYTIYNVVKSGVPGSRTLDPE